MSNALSKIKAPSNQTTQRQVSNGSIVSHQAVKGPKPKTFAENLMNMLALQNIG